MAFNNITLNGYLDKKLIFPTNSNIGKMYDGYRLDNLILTAVLTNQKEVDDLIDILKIHKHCFDE